MKLYNSIISAKNSSQIPVFISGKTMESRYNPEADAEKKAQNQEISAKIILVLGIGSGLFLKNLASIHENSFFIAVENSSEDITFLKQLNSFNDLNTLSNIKIISVEELETCLKTYYLPSFYGNLQIIEQRPWIEEQKENYENIKSAINNSLKQIGADYSVQCHFGKIWQQNFLNNLISSKNYKKDFNYKIDTRKKAVIVAAGPSLDNTYSLLKNKSEYYIISTDTAYQSLLKRNIDVDAVVSIDGQNVSFNHFYNSTTPLFIFDITGNSKAIKKLMELNKDVYFINTGHPFINLLNYNIPYISAGSGTVTIAAFDFAVKTGFKDILILGADFSYQNGKAYTAGTYLDSLYYQESNKILPVENLYNKLQFRTELIKINQNKYTTTILNSYCESLENYLKASNCIFNKSNDIYEIKLSLSDVIIKDIQNQNIKSEIFFNILCKEYSEIKDLENISLKDLLNHNLSGFLPYIAYLRTKNEFSSYSISEFLKLAYKNIVRYN